MTLKFKNTYLFIAAFFTVTTSILFGCKKEDISESDFEINYYKQAQLQNIFDNEIAVLNQQFVNETSVLKTVSNEFSQNITLENLDALQLQWIKMLSIWKQMELYNIGDISDSFIHSSINFWPSNIGFIENFIASIPIIDEPFIESKGASSKGISAIEYLIFANSEPLIINSFTTDANAQNRLNYLVSCIQNLNIKAQELQQLWDAYKPDFINALENNTDGSQNQIINAQVALLEEIIIYKLGFPLGDNNGGAIDVEDLEALRSESSLEIIKQNLISLERSFTGEFEQTPFRIGFTDYLQQLGYDDLSDTILNQFKTCFNTIESIDNSLKQELLTSPENAIALQNEIRDLLVFIKVDMANAIGSTITFNDNDGD